jgi:hypothetical protein
MAVAQVEAANRKFIALKHHLAAIKLAEVADEDKATLRAPLPCLLLGVCWSELARQGDQVGCL